MGYMIVVIVSMDVMKWIYIGVCIGFYIVVWSVVYRYRRCSRYSNIKKGIDIGIVFFVYFLVYLGEYYVIFYFDMVIYFMCYV